MKTFKLSATLNLVSDQGLFCLTQNGKQIPIIEVKDDAELVRIRLNNKNLTVLKIGNRTFVAEKAIEASCCRHLCASCKRCSAAPDQDGGCQKIRDIMLDGGMSKEATVKAAKRIEKYPFIRAGYQTNSAFLVFSCNQYVFESNVRKGDTPNSAEMLKIKHGLSQYFDERISFEHFLNWHRRASQIKGDVVPSFTKYPSTNAG